MSMKQEVAEALKYAVAIVGRGDDAVAAQVLDIIYSHLDDRGDELVAKAKQHRVNAINSEIADLEAERDGLQTA